MREFVKGPTRRYMGYAVVLLVTALGAACGPGGGSRPTGTEGQQTGASQTQPQAERTLGIVVRLEPASIAAKPLRSSFVKVKTTVRLFNAGLDLIDDKNVAHPYLAEALP